MKMAQLLAIESLDFYNNKSELTQHVTGENILDCTHWEKL